MVQPQYEHGVVRGRLAATVAGLLLMAAVGCAKMAPDCSNAVTMELLRQSVERQLRTLPGSGALEGLEISFDAVRTLRRDFQTGAWQCATEVQLRGHLETAAGLEVLGLALSALGGSSALRVLLEQGPHELRYTSQLTDERRHHVWSKLQ